MNLEWAAIEAIAAIIGVIGLVISIIFLIVEVRHNARAIEGATVQSLMSLEREVFSLLADNAELMSRAASGRAKLNQGDLYRYERLVGTYMSLIYSAFIQFERGLVEQEVWQAYVNALARHMEAPRFREAWAEISIGYPASFQKEMKAKFSSVT